ncbi:MAG: hypothetical protein HQK65_10260 [Desulfamplus sp.]|nr:hypothetical protein [Desulfamplus sp.]
MDYNLILQTLKSYLTDHSSVVSEASKQIAAMEPDDAFEQKLITVLSNAISCFEINESLKKVTLMILKEGDFFNNPAMHKVTKVKFLEKILKDANYSEHSRQFNINAIQAYVDNIIHKQLYEINIKIEENQRSLNKIEAAAFKRRQEFKPENSSDDDNDLFDIEDSSSASNPLKKTEPPQTSNRANEAPERRVTKRVTPSTVPSQSQGTFLPSRSQRTSVPKTDTSTSAALTQYLLIEIENNQCAIKYDSIVEIFKFDKPVSAKVLGSQLIPRHKLFSFNKKNILKQMEGHHIEKKQMLINSSASLDNREDKNFAVVRRKDSDFYILFVDYIEYTEPVDASTVGDSAVTSDGNYKILSM